MLIRDATAEDWRHIWPFVHEIVKAADTFGYEPGMTEPQARDVWMLGPPGRTVAAVTDDGAIVGSAKMHPNHGGPGSHVATASFMVAPSHRKAGVGRALGEHALEWARSEGYRAMQFNAVVEANTAAVALWRSLGFEILATIPEAFRHPTEGYVGLHIMYRRLGEGDAGAQAVLH